MVHYINQTSQTCELFTWRENICDGCGMLTGNSDDCLAPVPTPFLFRSCSSSWSRNCVFVNPCFSSSSDHSAVLILLYSPFQYTVRLDRNGRYTKWLGRVCQWTIFSFFNDFDVLQTLVGHFSRSWTMEHDPLPTEVGRRPWCKL